MLQTPLQSVFVGALLIVACVAIGTIGFSLIESWPLLDSFYMTIITITTVGYGEVEPLSRMGRLFTSFIILCGLGAVFFTTTMLGRFILETEFKASMERRQMKRRIENLRDHIIVCGFGRTGRMVAEGLEDDGFPFCVVDNAMVLEHDLEESGYPYMVGDATEESLLEEAGIRKAVTVMALLSSDADNLYLTFTAKELNPKIKVVARALDEKAEQRLKRGGADSVVATFKIAGHRVLQAAVRPTVSEFIDLVSDRQQLSLFLEEMRVCPNSGLIDKSLEKVGIRNRYGVIIVTIKKASGEMLFNPSASEVLSEGDILIAIGEKDGLKRLAEGCNLPTRVS
jgi:voltage-gated potassium channel